MRVSKADLLSNATTTDRYSWRKNPNSFLFTVCFWVVTINTYSPGPPHHQLITREISSLNFVQSSRDDLFSCVYLRVFPVVSCVARFFEEFKALRVMTNYAKQSQIIFHLNSFFCENFSAQRNLRLKFTLHHRPMDHRNWKYPPRLHLTSFIYF